MFERTQPKLKSTFGGNYFGKLERFEERNTIPFYLTLISNVNNMVKLKNEC
jgi:hypothetical protein